MAVEALLAAFQTGSTIDITGSERFASQEYAAGAKEALDRGIQWLVTQVEVDRHREFAPIGFYFAKLWYYERLYPLIFAASALTKAVQQYAETRP